MLNRAVPAATLPLALALVLTSTSAYAVDNIAELQLDSSKLLDLVDERVSRIDTGCPEIFDYQGTDTIIDHLVWDPSYLTWSAYTPMTFMDGNTEAEIQVETPVLVVPVVAHLKDVDCATDPACPLTQTTPLTVPLEFALTADTNQICATYQGAGIWLPPDTEALITGVADDLGSLCVDASMGAVTGLLGNLEVEDIAVSMSNSADRLAVRVEFDSPDPFSDAPLSSWVDFMDGTLAPSFGNDFSVFLDDGLLKATMAQRLEDAMTCDLSDPSVLQNPPQACTDDIDPTSGAWGGWSILGPTVTSYMNADLVTGGWCAFDIGLEPISLSMPLSLSPGGDAIETLAHVDWTANAGDVALCAAFNPFTLAIGSILPEAILALELAAVTYSDLDLDDLPAECTQVSDQDIECSFPFELPVLDLGSPVGFVQELQATTLFGLPEGLTLEGTVTPNKAVAGPRVPLSLSGSPITYGVKGGCSSLHVGYEGELFADASWGGYCPDPREPAPVEPGPFDPPLVFRPVLDDPYGVYGLTGVGVSVPDEMTIHFPWSDPTQFWAEGGYPFVATVWTTAGSGSIELPTPVQDVGDQMWWYGELLQAQLLCSAEQTGWMGIPGMFDPEWMIDPPPWRLVSDDRLWDGASVTIEAAQLLQTGPMEFSERTGTVALADAELILSLKVAGAEDSFLAEVTVDPGSLSGLRVREVDVLTFDEALEVELELELPSRGVGMLAVSLSPEAAAWGGVAEAF